MDYRTREATNEYLNGVSRRVAEVGHWADEADELTRKVALMKLTTIEDLTGLKKDLFDRLMETRKLYGDLVRERNVLIVDRGKMLDEDLEGFIVEMTEAADKAHKACEKINDARERLMDRMIEKMEELRTTIGGLELVRDELEEISKGLRAKVREYDSWMKGSGE